MLRARFEDLARPAPGATYFSVASARSGRVQHWASSLNSYTEISTVKHSNSAIFYSPENLASNFSTISDRSVGVQELVTQGFPYRNPWSVHQIMRQTPLWNESAPNDTPPDRVLLKVRRARATNSRCSRGKSYHLAGFFSLV